MRDKLNIYIIFASIDVWQSYFTHTCCQKHFTLFCRKFTFVVIFTLFGVTQFWLKLCLCKKVVFFHVWCRRVCKSQNVCPGVIQWKVRWPMNISSDNNLYLLKTICLMFVIWKVRQQYSFFCDGRFFVNNKKKVNSML